MTCEAQPAKPHPQQQDLDIQRDLFLPNDDDYDDDNDDDDDDDDCDDDDDGDDDKDDDDDMVRSRTLCPSESQRFWSG